ncbi:MAG TPA: hypothetical protein PLU30_17435 [Verrucomicrobiae bacterium]|mgnify:CR=1 FL=1|nr:hypothetical protein [Verrucomicrobiae bacterium]
MSEERESYVVHGQHRGLIATGDASHVESANGKIHREEVYETFDINPYRLLNREGTRNRRFPKLRLTENRVEEGKIGKARITMAYDDEWTYRQGRYSRFPRGLVETGTSLQSNSFPVLMRAAARSGMVNAVGEISATVHYRAATRTYRYYSGLPAGETRSAGAPPRLGGVEILKVDLGRDGAGLARWGFNVGSINPRFRWTMTSARNVESGGFWVMEEGWAMMMDPWYVCYFGGAGGGSQKDALEDLYV